MRKKTLAHKYTNKSSTENNYGNRKFAKKKLKSATGNSWSLYDLLCLYLDEQTEMCKIRQIDTERAR